MDTSDRVRVNEGEITPEAVDIDELYELYRAELSEFTERRNALAKRLREGGERAAAEWVRKLSKPVVTAWVVNRLFSERGEDFGELLLAGEEVRRAQQVGEGLQDATERRRRAIGVLLDAAEEVLVAGDHGTSAGGLHRIGRTLEALAAYGEAAPQPAGRLYRDLEPPGFEALLGLALSAGSGGKVTGRVGHARGKRQGPRPAGANGAAAERKEAAAAARARKKELERLGLKTAEKEERLAAVSEASKSAEKARTAAEERQANAERGLKKAEEAMAKARGKLESVRQEAAQAVKLHRQRELQRLTAEKELEAAQRALERLQSDQ